MMLTDIDERPETLTEKIDRLLGRLRKGDYMLDKWLAEGNREQYTKNLPLWERLLVEYEEACNQLHAQEASDATQR